MVQHDDNSLHCCILHRRVVKRADPQSSHPNEKLSLYLSEMTKMITKLILVVILQYMQLKPSGCIPSTYSVRYVCYFSIKWLFFYCVKKKKSSSCSITQGWSYAFSHNGSRGTTLSFPSHIHNDTILPPFQSNPKIVGGLPCPDPVGGLDPSETPVLESHYLPVQTQALLHETKAPSPSSTAIATMLVTFFLIRGANSCLILQHLGVGGKWVSEGRDVWPKFASIC